MTNVDPVFAYLAALLVVQPAQIQDIESAVVDLYGKRGAKLRDSGELRRVHKLAQEGGLVIAIRKGVYAASKSGRRFVRIGEMWPMIDNRRLFLMKARKKGIFGEAK